MAVYDHPHVYAHPSNTVTLEQLESLLNEAESQEHVFWDKELVVSYKLRNGFTVLGRAAVVDPRNFNLEVGRRVAYQHALDQLWSLEGYMLQTRLYESGQLPSD